MFGSFAGSRFALTLRRLKSRFGLASSSRVAIRTEVPWYLRAVGIVVVAGLSLALAGWTYDAGRRFAGFDSSETADQLAQLRAQVGKLEGELESARKVADGSDSRLRIEKTAQEQLTQQIRRLEEENTRLKADLAMFENLSATAPADAGPSISKVELTAEPAAGGYRYRVLVAQRGDRKERDFSGHLQLVASVQQGTQMVMMTFPRPGDPDAGKFAATFKHFGRLEGIIRIPPGASIQRLEARLVQDGAVKATRSVAL